MDQFANSRWNRSERPRSYFSRTEEKRNESIKSTDAAIEPFERRSADPTQHPAPDPVQAVPFLNQWNQLVSTTNWEKGRIICEWRDALLEEGAASNTYSDEAWSNLVGGVTGQHVGRLRRVFQRFGTSYQDYQGLFWSHFQIACEWEDAEMWLEGAVREGWSVSQMRAARWEAQGAPDELKPKDEDIISAEVDEDMVEPLRSTVAEVGADEADEDEEESVGDEVGSAGADDSSERATAASRESGPKSRPFQDLPEMPDDIAEAFEHFKLAILAHKMTGWSEISRADLVSCIDALRALATAPSEGASESAGETE